MSDEIERLQFRVMELEELLGMREQFPPQLEIPRQRRIILGMLLRRESVSKEALITVLYQGNETERGFEPSVKSIEVQICHLRKALEPYGIEIETMWGRGYFMTREMKAKCSALFDSMREAA